MIKVGDWIKYTVDAIDLEVVGVVTLINEAGGTLRIKTVNGWTRWVVTSGCKVLS